MICFDIKKIVNPSWGWFKGNGNFCEKSLPKADFEAKNDAFT
jgi:hypothetical protein